MTQEIAITVKGDTVSCSIDKKQVATFARSEVVATAKLKLAEAAKTARLRELRLAKEASDQAAAVLEKPKPKANSAGVRRKPSRSAS